MELYRDVFGEITRMFEIPTNRKGPRGLIGPCCIPMMLDYSSKIKATSDNNQIIYVASKHVLVRY